MKFGVQKGISDTIWVGNINKKGSMFLNKEDKTAEALLAVLLLIKENDTKNMTTELRYEKNRYILSFTKVQSDTNASSAEKDSKK